MPSGRNPEWALTYVTFLKVPFDPVRRYVAVIDWTNKVWTAWLWQTVGAPTSLEVDFHRPTPISGIDVIYDADRDNLISLLTAILGVHIVTPDPGPVHVGGNGYFPPPDPFPPPGP